MQNTAVKTENNLKIVYGNIKAANNNKNRENFDQKMYSFILETERICRLAEEQLLAFKTNNNENKLQIERVESQIQTHRYLAHTYNQVFDALNNGIIDHSFFDRH